MTTEALQLRLDVKIRMTRHHLVHLPTNCTCRAFAHRACRTSPVQLLVSLGSCGALIDACLDGSSARDLQVLGFRCVKVGFWFRLQESTSRCCCKENDRPTPDRVGTSQPYTFLLGTRSLSLSRSVSLSLSLSPSLLPPSLPRSLSLSLRNLSL